MNILILGAAGFIGTNLILRLNRDECNRITVVDQNKAYFVPQIRDGLDNVTLRESSFDETTDFDMLVQGQDIVYHLVSTSVPSTSNRQIPEELKSNVVMSALLLDACVRESVGRVVFISSGGTVYGKEVVCPVSEETPLKPITSYGIQKMSIEKLLYLYQYTSGLDYRIIRLANPYGPYQRPNGILGVITTLTYKALKGEDLVVYGDGSVVRDFIYIDDTIRGILNIVKDAAAHKTYNLGSGYGTSIQQVVDTICKLVDRPQSIRYTQARNVDIPTNYLDITRYESEFGKLNPIPLEEGIRDTIAFMRAQYHLAG